MSEEPQVRILTGVLESALDPAETTEFVEDTKAGAVVSFQGVVRNHDNERDVAGIDYSAHPQAEELLAQVALEVANKFPIYAIAVQHRVGQLQVGDLAMHASVSAAHRGEAFQACQELVDTIKARVPIWKKQYFPGAGYEWVGTP